MIVTGNAPVMVRNMLSPAQVADRVGCGRSSVMRALESKALKASRDNKNRWKIAPEDADEWAKLRPVIDRSEPGHVPGHVPSSDRDEAGHVREELAAANATISGLEARLADTQAERDRLARLLERMTEERSRGLLARLFGQR